VPWTTSFDEAARNKLRYAFLDNTPESGYSDTGPDGVAQLARHWILRDEGMASLAGYGDREALADLVDFYAKFPDDLMPSLIEAVALQ
jgi:hypothetical protein